MKPIRTPLLAYLTPLLAYLVLLWGRIRKHLSADASIGCFQIGRSLIWVELFQFAISFSRFFHLYLNLLLVRGHALLGVVLWSVPTPPDAEEEWGLHVDVLFFRVIEFNPYFIRIGPYWHDVKERPHTPTAQAFAPKPFYRLVDVAEELPALGEWVTTIDEAGNHFVYRLTAEGWNLRDAPADNTPTDNLPITHWLDRRG